MTENDHEPAAPKIIAGTAVAAVGLRLGPEAALALGAAGYKFESLALKTWQALAPEARRRSGQVLAAAAQKLGCDEEVLDEFIRKSEQTRLMTGIAMSAGERTTWPQQVVALGKLLADGLIADGDKVDMLQFALNAMSDLGRLDVALLELLVRHQPDRDRDGRSVIGALEPPAMYDFTDPTAWQVGQRIWREGTIRRLRPELDPVLLSVAGTLTRHGLAVQIDRTREALEQLSEDMRKQLGRQAADAQRSKRMKMPTLNPTNLARNERFWAPTQLGEQVMDYYDQAAEETGEQATKTPTGPDDDQQPAD